MLKWVLGALVTIQPGARVSIKLRCWVQLRTEGAMEPLNAAALPPGGLRQDHHGYESMPVSPADARPYSAVLTPNNFSSSLTNATGMVSLLVAPDNSSIVSALSPQLPLSMLLQAGECNTWGVLTYVSGPGVFTVQ